MDAKKSDEGEAHERGMKTKIVGAFVIAGLIAMAVFVGTAAANGEAEIYGSASWGVFEYRHDFKTTNNLYAWGDFGLYSYTYGNQPCPTGCGGRVYVVEHRDTWNNDDPLTDVSGGPETLSWSNRYFVMAWPKNLTPGTYELILDLNVSGHPGVWTDIPNPYSGVPRIIDPRWTIEVTNGPTPPTPLPPPRGHTPGNRLKSITAGFIASLVTIDCHGTVTDVANLEETHSTQNISDSNLTYDECVEQIMYDLKLSAIDGITQYTKDFTYDGTNAPNLAVDKRLGYLGDPTSLISWVDSTENVGMSIVTEGENGSIGGMESRCPWAEGACIPASAELVAAGSQLSNVDLVTAQSKTFVQTIDSPRLHHEIDARGNDAWGYWMDEAHTKGPYGIGTVSAGIDVSVQKGHGCINGSYPLAGTLTYNKLITASGYWKFYKEMTYESPIPTVPLPRTYPVFFVPA